MQAADHEPQVRARFCQEWLERVAEEEDPWRERFFARVAPTLKETIASTTRVAWLPLAVHVELADILQETFGAVRAHAYYRRVFAVSLSGPLFAGIVETGARLLGLTPAMFVRWASKGWDAGFKNAGQLVGEVLGPGRGQLVYRDLAAACVASDAWLLSCQASAYGAFDMLGVDGVVRLDVSGRKENRMVLDLEWAVTGG